MLVWMKSNVAGLAERKPLQLLVPSAFSFPEIVHQLSSSFSYVLNRIRGGNRCWSSCDTQPRSVHDTNGGVDTSPKKRSPGQECVSVSSDCSSGLLH